MFTKEDFSIGQRVEVTELLHSIQAGTIKSLDNDGAIVMRDINPTPRFYVYKHIRPIDAGESIPKSRDDDDLTPLTAGIAIGAASSSIDEVPIPDSPFEGGGGISAGGGAESSFEAPESSPSADFSNVESGSESTASP